MTNLSNNNYQKVIRSALAYNSDNIFLYWKGRVALYAALKAAGITSGDEVIIPGLTCVVVPNAILYCGAIPVYADVRSDTLTMDVDSAKKLINAKTKAIIIQNTFGLSADVDTLVDLARSRHILVLEDCTHGFGGYFKGQANGTLADASFFSTQWNKPYSTGLGGILLVNRPECFPWLAAINSACIAPSKQELLGLWLSLQARRFLLHDASYWLLLRLFRWLSKVGLVTGSSSTQEIKSTVMPADFLKQHSPLQASTGMRALASLDEVMAMRERAALAYREVLANHNKWHVSPLHDANNAHLKFPVLINDRRAFFSAAEKAQVRLSDWFVSPIHPVENDLSLWHLDVDTIPIATALAQKLVTINTEVADVEKVCRFLSSNLGLIEPN